MTSRLLQDLDPVPRATLSEQVAKRLAARIIAGDWKSGEKLPSEAELCKVFNIGRSSLREALTSLAFIGLIRVRAGGGSFVADQPSAYFNSTWLNTGLLTSEQKLGEFVEARMILETEVAALCAERVSAEELESLRQLVEKMKPAISKPDEFWKLDLAFHLGLSGAAKNEVLHNILVGVREQMMELITKSLLEQEGMELAVEQHTRLIEALEQHSPAKARQAMRSHLQSFQRGYKVLLEAPE